MRLSGRRTRSRRSALVTACAVAIVGTVASLSFSTGAVAASATVPPLSSAHGTSIGAGDSSAAAAVTVYAGNAGTESAGESVTVTIGIGNTTAAFIGTGTATVSLTSRPLATRDSLDDWLKPAADEPSTRVIGTVSTQPVAAGSTQRVATVTIPASAVKLSGHTAVYGLEASVSTPTGKVGVAHSSLTFMGAGPQNTVGLAIAMPITVPATAAGLIPSDDLATYTAPSGILTREWELARDHPNIAIGIDPMIIASIRVLGTSAPQSALQWLTDLSLLTNDSFPLQYADADVATELQSGFTSLLAPTSFDYVPLDPRNFPTPLAVGEVPESTPQPTTNPFVTPTPTATPAPNVPTLGELLSWPYTYSGIAWPADHSVRASDLTALSSAGYRASIVSGSNTNASSLAETPNSPLAVKDGTALVTDQRVSTALRQVIAAITPDEQNAAVAAVSAQLAEISTQNTGKTVILAGLDRNWPSNEADASRALNSIFDLPEVTTASLRDALTAPKASGLKLTDVSQDPARTAAVHELADAAGQLDAFSTVLTNPALLTGDTRNQLLSLLSVAWLQPDNDWASAVSAFSRQTSKTVQSVQIVPTGKITVAATQSLIPVTVTNAFHLPVNIVLRASPSNGRLNVDSDTEKTVPAQASAKVLVSVKAKLGNGSVHLGLHLYSPTNVPIGIGQTAAVDVHADWEGLGALVLGIVVVLFFGFGLARSILRRRKARREAQPNAATGEDDAGERDAGAGRESSSTQQSSSTPEPTATPDDEGAPRG